MRYLILILALVALNSCQSEINAKFVITNKTENTIDSINIKSFVHESNPNYLKLESRGTQIYWLDMKKLSKVLQ